MVAVDRLGRSQGLCTGVIMEWAFCTTLGFVGTKYDDKHSVLEDYLFKEP